MKLLIRAALTALSLATIPVVANAGAAGNTAPTVRQDNNASWANG
jgi:hypothetical protein